MIFGRTQQNFRDGRTIWGWTDDKINIHDCFQSDEGFYWILFLKYKVSLNLELNETQAMEKTTVCFVSWYLEWRWVNSMKWHNVLNKTMFLSAFAYFVLMIRTLPPSEVSFQVDNFVVFWGFGWVTHSFLLKHKSLCECGHLIQSRSCIKLY